MLHLGLVIKDFSPPTFIERIYNLNPRKSPHDRWSYDENNKYVLLRAVREAERQCVARKRMIKKNSNNLTAKNKQNKINSVEKKQQYWNTYNRTRRANLRIDEIDEIKRYFKNFSGKGSLLDGTNGIDFDKINRLLDEDNNSEIMIYIQTLRRGGPWRHNYNADERTLNKVDISQKETMEIIGKLEDYMGHVASRQSAKQMYNRSNIERNKYYEGKRADELKGLF